MDAATIVGMPVISPTTLPCSSSSPIGTVSSRCLERKISG